MNRLTVNTCMEIASSEALVQEAYKDSGGVWTWSIGITSMSGHDVSRYIKNKQSISKCLDMYIWMLDKYLKPVLKAFEGVDLPENVLCGALSFHMNTGSIHDASWVVAYKKGDMRDAERRLKLWNKDNGKVVQGLVNRRNSEADLIFRGFWSNPGYITVFPEVSNGKTVFAKRYHLDARTPMRKALDRFYGVDTSPVSEEKASIWDILKKLLGMFK